jgi:hypothetical protein
VITGLVLKNAIGKLKNNMKPTSSNEVEKTQYDENETIN